MLFSSPSAAAQDHHPARPGGEVHDRLPGGVRRAHDHHVLALDGGGLGGRRAVVDARAGEGLHPGGLQPRVVHPRRDEDAVAADLRAAVERDHPRRPVLADGEHLAGGEHLRAQAQRLGRRAPREVGAADAGREPEVVLDPRALARLPARRVALHQERPQALGRSVDRRRQPGRPAAEDDEVVEGELRRRVEADPARRSRPGRAAPASRRPRTRAPGAACRPARPRSSAGAPRGPRCRASGTGRRSGRRSRGRRAPPRRTGAPRAAGPARRAARPSPPPSPPGGRRARGTAAPRAGSRASSGSGRGAAR